LTQKWQAGSCPRTADIGLVVQSGTPSWSLSMASPAQSSEVIRFGAFELDAANGELRNAGISLKIHPQPLQVLSLLVKRAGQTVTREEIQHCLWGDNTFVDFERGINSCISQIRAALGDDPEKPRYVETLPRRGYRFIAPVTINGDLAAHFVSKRVSESSAAAMEAIRDSRAAAAAGKRKYFLAALALAAVMAIAIGWQWHVRHSVAPIRSLAVLPFANLSGDPTQDYFADGMTEALITELGKVSELRVISRQSTMQYKGTNKSVPEIARELKVDAVVEGSVVRVGDRARVTVQLIEAALERHLWANSYDRQMSDVLTLHGEVARTVAKEIKVTLTPQDETRLADTRAAVNPAADEAYLRGRYFLDRRTKDDLDKALGDFQQAVALDPTFAPAQASLAEAYLGLAMYDPAHRAELLQNAQVASLKALDLDDGLSAAHYTQAAHRMTVWDWSGAEAEYRRAIELNPNDAASHMWYADLLLSLGRTTEANAEIRRAQELDPASLEIYSAATAYLYYERRYEEFIDHCQGWVKRNPDLEWNYHHCLGAAYVQMGRHEEAIAELREALKSSTLFEHTATELANALAVAGQRDEALKVLDRIENVPWKTFGAALVYTGLGEKDEAFRSLNKAIDLRAPFATLLKVDPRFDSLRNDPRFAGLLRRMNLPA